MYSVHTVCMRFSRKKMCRVLAAKESRKFLRTVSALMSHTGDDRPVYMYSKKKKLSDYNEAWTLHRRLVPSRVT